MKSNKLANMFKNSNVNYCKSAKVYLVVVAALLISAIVLISVIGFNAGFDFAGGTIVEVVYDVEFDSNGNQYENGTPYDKSAAMENIEAVLKDVGGFQLASIQTETGEFGDVVVYKLLTDSSPTNEQLDAIKTKLFEKFLQYDQNGLIQKNYISVYNVNETKTDVAIYAAIALSVALVIIVIGAIFRFGLGEAISLFISTLTNILIAFAIVLICRIAVNVTFVAAVITIFVLSVIFNLIYLDKLRENSKNKEFSKEEKANISAKQSLPTSLLILAVSLICSVFLGGFGVLSIREFALPVMIGVFFVTFTSAFMLPLLCSKIEFKQKKRNRNR